MKLVVAERVGTQLRLACECQLERDDRGTIVHVAAETYSVAPYEKQQRDGATGLPVLGTNGKPVMLTLDQDTLERRALKEFARRHQHTPVPTPVKLTEEGHEMAELLG